MDPVKRASDVASRSSRGVASLRISSMSRIARLWKDSHLSQEFWSIFNLPSWRNPWGIMLDRLLAPRAIAMIRPVACRVSR